MERPAPSSTAGPWRKAFAGRFRCKLLLRAGAIDSAVRTGRSLCVNLFSHSFLPFSLFPSAQPKQRQPKRPMTFEDMMTDEAAGRNRRLAGRQVAGLLGDHRQPRPKHQDSGVVDAGDCRRRAKASWPWPSRDDSGPQFAPDGKRILFLSGREGGQQIWLADFDPATGATSNAKKLTGISTEADNAHWSPDGNSVVFTSAVYPDCPAISPADGGVGDKCNADRDAALAASKVKAQIFTHLLYRHWDHYTGDKRSHLFLFRLRRGAHARPESQRSARRSAVFAREKRLRMRLCARLEGAGVYREPGRRSRRSRKRRASLRST